MSELEAIVHRGYFYAEEQINIDYPMQLCLLFKVLHSKHCLDVWKIVTSFLCRTSYLLYNPRNIVPRGTALPKGFLLWKAIRNLSPTPKAVLQRIHTISKGYVRGNGAFIDEDEWELYPYMDMTKIEFNPEMTRRERTTKLTNRLFHHYYRRGPGFTPGLLSSRVPGNYIDARIYFKACLLMIGHIAFAPNPQSFHPAYDKQGDLYYTETGSVFGIIRNAIRRKYSRTTGELFEEVIPSEEQERDYSPNSLISITSFTSYI